MGRKTKRFVGEKRGYLEILEVLPQGIQGKHVNIRVFCHNCKTESVKDSVTFNKSKSCGCDRSNLSQGKIRKTKSMPWQLTTGMAARNNIVSAYRIGAKRRRLVWELENEVCYALFKQPCFYCGITEYSVKKGLGKTSGDYSYNGIDRLNSSIGYTLENSVSCCWKCNNMKGTLHMRDFFEHIEKVKCHIDLSEKCRKELAKIAPTLFENMIMEDH